MKMTAAAVAIILILSSFCIYFNIYTKETVGYLTAESEKIKNLTVQKNYEEAGKIFFELKDNWKEKEKVIQVMTEHNELDYINQQFALLSADFENHEYDEIFEALYTLEFFFKHIYEKKKINLSTLL